MPIKLYYDKILTKHNMNPKHKHTLPKANLELCGSNPNCGDMITLHLLVDDDGKILDGSFTGDGCAVSQASADMMLERIIGADMDQVLHLCNIFMKMTRESVSASELGELGEAGGLKDISRMPSRVRCATLGWYTLKRIFDDIRQNNKT